jgi:hypothetical protein
MVCTLGLVDDVRLLLDAGADATLEGKVWEEDEDVVGDQQEFPLSAAAWFGHTEVTYLLYPNLTLNLPICIYPIPNP